jgi:starch phosphorylase
MEDPMSGKLPVGKPTYAALCNDIQGFELLAELALDLRWSWNHEADKLWEELDPRLWDLTHDPWGILQTVSREQIRAALGERTFRQRVDGLVRAKRQAAQATAWFTRTHARGPLSCVAYFSMEFMLSEALPIYSGGLGNVAGDLLKAASDLGVPVIGVGLLYQQGYFRQVIDMEGGQQALFPYNDPGQLPISPLRGPHGEWWRLPLTFSRRTMWVRAWQVQIGRTTLYLLDSNDIANSPIDRGITSELYGGGSELRLMQEIVLGIGGWRLLEALDVRPEICHLNEGHAAFAVLERARGAMRTTGQPFDAALAATRPGNVFTSHTAVPAGFDRFEPRLVEQHLGAYARDELGLARDEFLALGRNDPRDDSESFNMAYLAVRGSGRMNGVSRLHGQVSRRVFAPLFSQWPVHEVPIGHVTNGVHMPSWDSEVADELWTEACGKDRWLGTMETLEQDIRRVPDGRLWNMRNRARLALVRYARSRLARELAVSGASPEAVEQARSLFDPLALTIGFARRFATYKRPSLLLYDSERLLRILSRPEQPVQLIIAGKAHPADAAGQALVKEWVQFIRNSKARHRVAFLADYDMLLTERLVQGVDVWLNTPRRPWEACGTSGMKALVNGALNLSALDGWWAEAYTPGLGWALGDGQEHGDDPSQDARDAQALYDLLEREIIPEFYRRDEHGVPTGWVAKMRESMALLTTRFSANRALRQYTEQYYLPAAAAFRARAADSAAAGGEIAAWQRALQRGWPALRFGALTVGSERDQHVFEVQVFLGDIDPSQVRVELFADGSDGAEPLRLEMKQVGEVPGAPGGLIYRAIVSSARPAFEFTPRVIPHHAGVEVPLECSHVLWQR